MASSARGTLTSIRTHTRYIPRAEGAGIRGERGRVKDPRRIGIAGAPKNSGSLGTMMLTTAVGGSESRRGKYAAGRRRGGEGAGEYGKSEEQERNTAEETTVDVEPRGNVLPLGV